MLAVTIALGGEPPLWLFMGYLLLTFFGVGFVFGNLNALTMEPLGHIAGIGAAGHYSVTWDASEFPSGIYFCTIETPVWSAYRKMLLVR